MVQVVAVPAGGRARAGVVHQVMAFATGGALVAAAPGAALAGGVTFFATPPVAPEPPGALGHAHSAAQTGMLTRPEGLVAIVCDGANLVLFLNLRKKCKHVMQCCGPGPSQPLSLHSGSQGPGRTKTDRLVTPFWQ